MSFISRMSRRQWITGSTMGLVGVLAGCDVGSRSHSSTKLTGVNLLRSQLKSLQPSTFVKTYNVDLSGTPGSFRTFKEAYSAIMRDRAARIGAAAQGQSNPWDWRVIYVSPGIYHECIVGIPPHTAIIGQGKRPSDVRIWWDGGENTFESTGRSTYVRNVHLDHTSLDADAHPMRDNGPSGDVDLQDRQRRTVIFEDVIFSSAPLASLGKCTNDMAPRNGVYIVFNRCHFYGPGQPQSINLITDEGSAPVASTIAFIGCRITSNHSQHPSAQLEQLSNVDAAPFGAPDFSGGRGDRVLWMDGQWDVGKVQGVQGLLVFPYVKDGANISTNKMRPSTRYFLVNPGSVNGIKTVLTQGTLAPASDVPSDFQLPVRCISDQEAEFYGSEPHGSSSLTPSESNEGKMNVKAGDIYWVSCPAPRTAIFASNVSLRSLSAGVFSAAVSLDKNGQPFADGNAGTYGGIGKEGELAVTVPPRWFYPGQGKLWLGVSFSEDSEVSATTVTGREAFKGAASQPGQMLIPNNLIALGAGSFVPMITLTGSTPAAMNS